MFMLRIYAKNGSLKREEVFQTEAEMDSRYHELNHGNELDPTAWMKKGNHWLWLPAY